ncbi:MAG: hypothetical protein QOE24_2815, partial [Frankiales bacterium]|nr:hypothetical protein [Frankiales bacterium]
KDSLETAAVAATVTATSATPQDMPSAEVGPADKQAVAA